MRNSKTKSPHNSGGRRKHIRANGVEQGIEVPAQRVAAQVRKLGRLQQLLAWGPTLITKRDAGLTTDIGVRCYEITAVLVSRQKPQCSFFTLKPILET